MCLYPNMVRNPKYQANKKNGGIIPPVTDTRILFVPIGCGKCIECMKQKANGWKIRMTEEVRVNNNATFVTLTFSNESYAQLAYEVIDKAETQEKTKGYALDNGIAILAVRRFTERWRKKYKKSIRHWLITEIGHNGSQCIHLHGILWTKDKNEINKIWGYGYTYCGDYVNEKTVNYITKYVTKVDPQHRLFRPVILTSNGIGGEYTKSGNFQVEQI